VPFTLVSFHAHPDDEALLTGGTLARAAAEGHRVVLVTATDGGAGLAASGFGHGEELAATRRAELDAAARALGVARTVRLGYADSGLDGTASGSTFLRAAPEVAAIRLAEILTAERADVLTGYDAAGGYGHPDHVRVHEVARRAAELAAVPVLLEATVDRDALLRGLRLARLLRVLPSGVDLSGFAHAYTPHSELTHRVDVAAHLPAKLAALRAHASQATADDPGLRTVAALLRLPRPLARLVLGREWFHAPDRRPGPLSDDVFAGLR
jgi:LmbE family N-acetylglucosaminyl deacetylase